MGEESKYFGGPEGDVPEYNQTDDMEINRLKSTYGVYANVEDELEVVENDPVSLSVVLKTGWAFVHGAWYHNKTDPIVKTLGAADPDHPRIDRIVLRLDTTEDFKISSEVLEGTPGADPDPPELTQEAATYEISLAQVLVGATETSVSDAEITDEREYVTVPSTIEQSLIITQTTSSATPTPARASKKTLLEITALAAAAEFQTPSGTPQNGDQIFISVTDDGTGRALTYVVIYDDPYSASFYDTTTAGKTIFMHLMYSSARTKWELLSADEEA